MQSLTIYIVEHKTQADSLHFKGEKYLKRAEHVSG
jgi:hypothetical protein